MGTLNISTLDEDDLRKAATKLKSNRTCLTVRIEKWDYTYLSAKGCIYAAGDLGKTNMANLSIFFKKYEGEGTIFSLKLDSGGIVLLEDSGTDYPVKISQLPRKQYNRERGKADEKREREREELSLKTYTAFATKFAELDAMNNEIIAALSVPSKEDFYDDASDYQDDEPTDFGDASNYDEGLLGRINKALKS